MVARVTACITLVLALCASRASVAHAQEPGDLVVGSRVRVSGERATNEGVRRFRVTGKLDWLDSSYVVLRPDLSPAMPDTIPALGVHRIEIFRGLRSRPRMIISGAAIGAVVGTTAWILGRQMFGAQKTTVMYDDAGNPHDQRTVVEVMRVAIPFLTVGGGLIGAVVGRESWLRIPIPSSVFPQPH